MPQSVIAYIPLPSSTQPSPFIIRVTIAIQTALLLQREYNTQELIEVSRHTLEVSRRNSENISALQLAQIRTEAALQVFQQHTDAAIERHNSLIERLTANDERTEQLLEYLIRRD